MIRHKILTVVIVVLTGWLTSCVGTTASGTLIEYRRTGGFAGLDDHLVIGVNGQTTLTRKAEQYKFVLDRDTMNQLLTLLDNAEFSKLRKEYLPPRKGSVFSST